MWQGHLRRAAIIALLGHLGEHINDPDQGATLLERLFYAQRFTSGNPQDFVPDAQFDALLNAYAQAGHEDVIIEFVTRLSKDDFAQISNQALRTAINSSLDSIEFF